MPGISVAVRSIVEPAAALTVGMALPPVQKEAVRMSVAERV
jgi:hypothetical protein